MKNQDKDGVVLAKYDAVLFDVDGTLLHSSPGIIESMEFTFRQMGMDPSKIDLTRYLGPPLRQSFGEHFEDEDSIEKMVQLYREEYKRTGQHMCTPYEGARELLQALRSEGILLYTATAKPVDVVTPILKEQKIHRFFNAVGGATMDKSAETKTAVVRMVLSRPELCGKRVLMVGDRHDDMRGAKDCGIPAAGVLYGYGSREELEPFEPVILANSCAELAHYILDNKNK